MVVCRRKTPNNGDLITLSSSLFCKTSAQELGSPEMVGSSFQSSAPPLLDYIALSSLLMMAARALPITSAFRQQDREMNEEKDSKEHTLASL